MLDADPIRQLIVDLFTHAHAAAVLAARAARPGACPAVLAQRDAQVHIYAVVAAVGATDLPLSRSRDRYTADVGPPGGERAAAAVTVERARTTEAGTECAEPGMGPGQCSALLVAVTGIALVTCAIEHCVFQFPVTRGPVRTAGIE
ncbi:hypothetical protein D3C76_1360600 [compost metagenome]